MEKWLLKGAYLANRLYPGYKHLNATQLVEYLKAQSLVLVCRVGVNRMVDMNGH